MLDILTSLILDFQEALPETGVRRRVDFVPVHGKATVCIGVRRGGKSTWLFQIMEGLLAGGVARENILYLNFFDDRLHNLRPDQLGLILDAYYSLYPEKKSTETVYYFFDEIQAQPGWEAFINRVLRTEHCEVYLTGSSARMLSREIATQMRGRALSWEMFPFSFREYLDFKRIDHGGALSTKQRHLVVHAFGEYWETGGFPEVAGLPPRIRVRVHQEYFQTILFRDLIERYDVSHPRAVTDLAHWLIDNIASMYSVNNLTGYLKALGHKVPKASVSDYLAWLEDAYFLFSVRIFDASLARSNTNPKKIYCIDHAFVRSVSSGILVNSGHLLENLVFTALRRVHPVLYYHKTRAGKEIDFVIPGRGRPHLVQVCETLAVSETKQREIAALYEAMAELSVDEAVIVTRSDSERIEGVNGIINVLPAWKFLLEYS